jgi:hypothetical protein
MALDLPAFERPAKATSAPASGSSCESSNALVTNLACLNEILMDAVGLRLNEGLVYDIHLRPEFLYVFPLE